MSMARIQKSRPLRDLTRTQFHCQVWNSLDQSPTARHVADPSSRFQIPCTAVPLRGKNQEQHAKHPNQLFLALGDGSTAPFWWGPILCRSLKTLLLSGGFLPTLWLPPPGNHWQYDAACHKLFSCLLMFMKQLIELHNITQLPRSSQSLQPQGQARLSSQLLPWRGWSIWDTRQLKGTWHRIMTTTAPGPHWIACFAPRDALGLKMASTMASPTLSPWLAPTCHHKNQGWTRDWTICLLVGEISTNLRCLKTLYGFSLIVIVTLQCSGAQRLTFFPTSPSCRSSLIGQAQAMTSTHFHPTRGTVCHEHITPSIHGRHGLYQEWNAMFHSPIYPALGRMRIGLCEIQATYLFNSRRENGIGR